MDDMRRFYAVRLGNGYVRGSKYVTGGEGVFATAEISITANSIEAAHQTEAAALKVAEAVGGEVCCFGIYDAEPSKKDPVFGQLLPSSGHQFDWALRQLMSGNRVQRQGWNGKGMWIAVQVPDENSKMTLPYIYMKTVTGALIPWLASQADLLYHDWVAVEGEPG